MADTLGELIVEISANASKFNAGLKEAEASMKTTAGKISEYTNKIGLTMTVAGAAITAAFAMMIKSSTDYAEQIYTVSQRTGIATETLSRLKFVADQTESSFEAVAQGFKFLNRNIYEAVNGNVKANESFKALGITLKDEVTGNVLTAEEAFFKIADVFKGLDDAATKTALAMQIFGRGGEGLIPILNLGSEEIRRLSQEAERLGIVLTKDNVQAIDRFSDSTKSLKAAFGGLWLNISQLLMPALEGLAKFATSFVVKIREWSEAHKTLSKFLSGTILAFGALLLVLGPLVLMFNQVAQAILFLNVIIPGLSARILLLGVALKSLSLIAIAAFVGWGIGRVISEITGLDKALSGPEGVFTKMFIWLDKNEKKIQNIQRALTAISTMGLSELFRKKETPETSPAAISTPASSDTTVLDTTIAKVEQHAQKLKEINEAYLTGKINASDYYNEISALHQDGLDIKQQELDLLNQSIELENLATEGEYQRLYVMGEGIRTAQEYYQIKAELANQDLMNQQTSLNAATNLLQTLQSMHKTIWQGIFDFINMGIQKFSSGFSTAISSIILGTKTASQAFKDFGRMMIEAIVNFVVEWAIQALIAKTLGSLLTAWVVTEANMIAAAWLPAAIFASVATLGGADAAGAAGLAGAVGAGTALFVGLKTTAAATGGTTLAEGGIVTKPTVALMGEAGPEAVIPLNKTNNLGNTFNIHIDSPTINSDIDIEDLAEEIGNNIERKLKRI